MAISHLPTTHQLISHWNAFDDTLQLCSQVLHFNNFVLILTFCFTFLQTEGLAMWVAAPGRDISTLSPSSFYNLPPQAQHMSFAPAQAGHSTFAGLYHPAHGVTTPTTVHPLLQQSQAMAGPVDMAGPGGGAYPKSQHGPINWPNNY